MLVFLERDWIIFIFGKSFEYYEYLINEFVKVSKLFFFRVLDILGVGLIYLV